MVCVPVCVCVGVPVCVCACVGVCVCVRVCVGVRPVDGRQSCSRLVWYAVWPLLHSLQSCMAFAA